MAQAVTFRVSSAERSTIVEIAPLFGVIVARCPYADHGLRARRSPVDRRPYFSDRYGQLWAGLNTS